MNDQKIQALPVRHLEWLFDPPGLPVPERIVGTTPTTSALVRGAAGTGKTTLALALAVGLAQNLGGKVYYLSTEIAPVDVRFKLGHLGLRADAVCPLDGADSTATILTEHLVLVSDADLEAPGARTTAALRRAEEIVLGETVEGVRVVVIDAFSLVGESTPTTRSRLAALVQGFDALGVSVVLVEEAPVTGADWASFVVDLVFDLVWGEDPDTRARIRQLAVPKSRFATAAYGPHDYGLDGGRLAVWPDLGAVNLEALREYIGGGKGPRILAPNDHVLFGLVSANINNGALAFRLVAASPWLRPPAWVEMSGVVKAGEGRVRASSGPAAIVWAVLRQLSKRASDSVMVVDTRFATARARFAIPFFGALQVLADLGPMVVVQGSAEELRAVPAAFTYSDADGGTPHNRRMLKRLWGRGIANATQLDELFERLPRNDEFALGDRRWWALWHAYLIKEEQALDWLLAQGPIQPAEEPHLRHALARNGRMAEAVARLQDHRGPLRRWLEAELHLNLFTEEGLAFAEPVYTELLGDLTFSDGDRELMRTQLEEVRTALRT